MSSDFRHVELHYYHQNNDNDRSGALWTIAGLGFAYVILTSAIRLGLRRVSFKVEDYVFIAALLVVIPTYGTLFAVVRAGFGRLSVPIDVNGTKLNTLFIVTRALHLISLGLCKTSVACLNRRLFGSNNDGGRIACNIVIGLTGLYTIAAPILVLSSCPNQTTCGLRHRIYTVVGLDILTEICLIAVPGHAIYGLHMDWSQKLSTWSLFLVRIFIIPVVVLLAFYNPVSQASNSANARLLYIGLAQFIIVVSFVTASLPCLRASMTAFRNVMVNFQEYYGDFAQRTAASNLMVGSAQRSGNRSGLRYYQGASKQDQVSTLRSRMGSMVANSFLVVQQHVIPSKSLQ